MRFGIVGIVAGIVLAVWAVASYPQPRAPEPDPFGDLQLSTDRARYTFGERMTLFLVNNGDRLFHFLDWAVQRFVDGEWIRVECHVVDTEDKVLGASATMTWVWTVEDASPAVCEGPFTTVEAGPYRGFVRLSLFADPLERGQLFAEFVVA